MSLIKTTLADKWFSLLVRTRDKWTCQRCHTIYEPPTAGLHCSHYHGRSKKSVRRDPENAVALCYGCHRYFTAHPLAHTEWFRDHIGNDAFDHLNIRANIMRRDDELLDRIWLKEELKKLGVDVSKKRRALI